MLKANYRELREGDSLGDWRTEIHVKTSNQAFVCFLNKHLLNYSEKKKKDLGVLSYAQRLRSFAAPAEVLNSVPNTLFGRLMTACDSGSAHGN